MKRYQTISEIYADLPGIECAGLCWRECSVIPMSNVERIRIRARGFTLPLATQENKNGSFCPALSSAHTCQVYQDRPLLCRLYGVAEGLRCEFGCEPERLLGFDEAKYLLSEANRLGGGSTLRKSEKPA